MNTTVDQEVCPINLAPTGSTTAQLVMGDALADCLMEIQLHLKILLFTTRRCWVKVTTRVKDMLEHTLKNG
jgi:arabinose-5-phosphate isomerase